MPRVSKEVQENVILHPSLSKIIFYLIEPSNANQLEELGLGSRSIIGQHLKKLLELKFLKVNLDLSNKKTTYYEINYSHLINEFLDFLYTKVKIDLSQNKEDHESKQEFEEIIQKIQEEYNKQNISTNPYLTLTMKYLLKNYEMFNAITLKDLFKILIEIIKRINLPKRLEELKQASSTLNSMFKNVNHISNESFEIISEMKEKDKELKLFLDFSKELDLLYFGDLINKRLIEEEIFEEYFNRNEKSDSS